MTPFDDRGMSFSRSYQNTKFGNLQKPLAKRLDELENLKEKANKKYRDGDFQEALKGYTTAWKEVLPHHVEALPECDPNRPRLGYLEAVVFANMSATCITLSKAISKKDGERKFTRMALRCAWVTFELREFAAATTVRNALLRANETLRKLHGSNQKLAPQYQQMSQYYTQQCKALENISKDTLFKDLDAELKIAPPSLAVLQTFGPRAWAQDWIQALPPILRPPPVETMEQRKKPRDLTPYELWAGWGDLPIGEWHKGLESFEMDILHPYLRVMYELSSSGRRRELNNLRLAKFDILRTIMLSTIGDVEFDLFMKMIKGKPVDERPLKEKVAIAELKKANANKIYRRGDILEAAAEYLFAWSMILPYHTTALAPSDPIRADLGKFESALWCNLSAAFIGIGKEPGDEMGSAGFRGLAYRCAWAAFEEREYATVSTVKNACLRAKDNFYLSRLGGGNDLEKQVTDVRTFFVKQAELLSDLPKDMMYADAPASKKLPIPDRETMKHFGPNIWPREQDMEELHEPFTFM